MRFNREIQRRVHAHLSPSPSHFFYIISVSVGNIALAIFIEITFEAHSLGSSQARQYADEIYQEVSWRPGAFVFMHMSGAITNPVGATRFPGRRRMQMRCASRCHGVQGRSPLCI